MSQDFQPRASHPEASGGSAIGISLQSHESTSCETQSSQLQNGDNTPQARCQSGDGWSCDLWSLSNTDLTCHIHPHSKSPGNSSVLAKMSSDSWGLTLSLSPGWASTASCLSPLFILPLGLMAIISTLQAFGPPFCCDFRHTHKDKDTHKHTQTQTHTDTQGHTQTQKQRHMKTDTPKHRQAQRYAQTETKAFTDTHRCTSRHTYRYTQRRTHTDTPDLSVW